MEDLQINNRVTIPASELSFSTSKSSGPGGQHANKTSSRVTLSWVLMDSAALSDGDRARVATKLASYVNADGLLQVSSDEDRSQHRNKEIVRERLAEMVRKALVRPKVRRKTKPSRAAKRRRVEAKKRRSAVKKSRTKPHHDD